jgi:hypothetical protein
MTEIAVTTTPGRRFAILLLLSLLVLAVVTVYFPVRTYPFLINVDDDSYVFNNLHVLHGLQWSEIRWAFTHSYAANYDPLDFLAHSINVRVFGMNAGLHHLVNVAFHALNVILLFWVLRRSTGFTGRSLAVAALFAVHPINVENVAWIAELKTLLSTTFFLLGLDAYLSYARRPLRSQMLVVNLLYGMGLLCKPQIITFPFVLLLWDYWPLRRMFPDGDARGDTQVTTECAARKLSQLIKEKSLLFFITAVDILLTLHAENKGDIERYTFVIRLGAAVRSYVVYIGKMFWPVNLGFNYPHPGYSLRWIEVWLALLLLVSISALVYLNRRRRYLIVGWLWFLGVMLPTVNLVQIDVSAVADRYAYISFIGLFLMIGWGSAEAAQQLRMPRFALPAVTIAALVILSVATRRQVYYWSDALTVWRRSVEVAPPNPRSEVALGQVLVGRGEIDIALKHFYKALEADPGDSATMLLVASLEQQRGNLHQAIALYDKGLTLSKDRQENAEALFNMAHAYEDLGDRGKALEYYQAARRLRDASLNRAP